MNIKKKAKCLLFQKRTQRYAQTGQLSKKMLKKIEKKPAKTEVYSKTKIHPAKASHYPIASCTFAQKAP